MSTFSMPVEVGDFEGSRWESLEAVVDTGATYTFIPSDVLQRLRVEPQEQRPFILANGQQVLYGTAWVRVRLDGREHPTLVIFGEPGSGSLLGAFTLEGFGLSADPVNERLTPVPGYLVGIRLIWPK
jgi:clan AA aspartic protease